MELVNFTSARECRSAYFTDTAIQGNMAEKKLDYQGKQLTLRNLHQVSTALQDSVVLCIYKKKKRAMIPNI